MASDFNTFDVGVMCVSDFFVFPILSMNSFVEQGGIVCWICLTQQVGQTRVMYMQCVFSLHNNEKTKRHT